MVSRLIALFSMAAMVSTQTPNAMVQSGTPQAEVAQATPVASPQMLTVPAGTAIPLTLINPIKKNSTHVGDAVRATVAFPIMAGLAVAVPAGSYVEGVVKSVTARASDTRQPAVGIHFTRLVYANGYSVALDATSEQAEEVAPGTGAPVAEVASLTMPLGREGMFAQSTPTLPTVSMPGPSPAVVTGAVLGGAAALVVTIFALAHHSQARIDYVLFDAGWQFQMVLASPLVVDAARVGAK